MTEWSVACMLKIAQLVLKVGWVLDSPLQLFGVFCLHAIKGYEQLWVGLEWEACCSCEHLSDDEMVRIRSLSLDDAILGDRKV